MSRKRERERGFSLLEVLVATVLTIGVVLAATSAVTGALHGVSLTDQHMALNDDALGVLADVRVASAYDPPATFGALAGRTSSMTIAHPGGDPETVTVTIARLPSANSALAIATVQQGNITVTQRETIFSEAPAPGSVVNQVVPGGG